MSYLKPYLMKKKMKCSYVRGLFLVTIKNNLLMVLTADQIEEELRRANLMNFNQRNAAYIKRLTKIYMTKYLPESYEGREQKV